MDRIVFFVICYLPREMLRYVTMSDLRSRKFEGSFNFSISLLVLSIVFL